MKINEICLGLRNKLCSVCPNKDKTNCGTDDNCKTIMHVTAIQALVKQLQAELKNLKEFARHAIRTGCWNLLDFEQDGCELQDLAEKLGLIEPFIVTAEDDYDDLDVGDTVFRFSDILKGK